MLGAVAGFLLARYVNAGLIDPESMPRLGPILQRAEAGGWRAVAALRLIPVLPHSVGNYALGLTRLPLGAYALGSLLGQLPMTIAYVDFGAAGGKIWSGASGWLAPTLDRRRGARHIAAAAALRPLRAERIGRPARRSPSRAARPYARPE